MSLPGPFDHHLKSDDDRDDDDDAATTPPMPATKSEMSTRICVMNGSSPPMSLNIFSNVGTTKIIIAARTTRTSPPIAIG